MPKWNNGGYWPYWLINPNLIYLSDNSATEYQSDGLGANAVANPPPQQNQIPPPLMQNNINNPSSPYPWRDNNQQGNFNNTFGHNDNFNNNNVRFGYNNNYNVHGNMPRKRHHLDDVFFPNYCEDDDEDWEEQVPSFENHQQPYRNQGYDPRGGFWGSPWRNRPPSRPQFQQNRNIKNAPRKGYKNDFQGNARSNPATVTSANKPVQRDVKKCESKVPVKTNVGASDVKKCAAATNVSKPQEKPVITPKANTSRLPNTSVSETKTRNNSEQSDKEDGLKYLQNVLNLGELDVVDEISDGSNKPDKDVCDDFEQFLKNTNAENPVIKCKDRSENKQIVSSLTKPTEQTVTKTEDKPKEISKIDDHTDQQNIPKDSNKAPSNETEVPSNDEPKDVDDDIVASDDETVILCEDMDTDESPIRNVTVQRRIYDSDNDDDIIGKIDTRKSYLSSFEPVKATAKRRSSCIDKEASPKRTKSEVEAWVRTVNCDKMLKNIREIVNATSKKNNPKRRYTFDDDFRPKRLSINIENSANTGESCNSNMYDSVKTKKRTSAESLLNLLNSSEEEPEPSDVVQPKRERKISSKSDKASSNDDETSHRKDRVKSKSTPVEENTREVPSKVEKKKEASKTKISTPDAEKPSKGDAEKLSKAEVDKSLKPPYKNEKPQANTVLLPKPSQKNEKSDKEKPSKGDAEKLSKAEVDKSLKPPHKNEKPQANTVLLPKPQQKNENPQTHTVLLPKPPQKNEKPQSNTVLLPKTSPTESLPLWAYINTINDRKISAPPVIKTKFSCKQSKRKYELFGSDSEDEEKVVKIEKKVNSEKEKSTEDKKNEDMKRIENELKEKLESVLKKSTKHASVSFEKVEEDTFSNFETKRPNLDVANYAVQDLCDQVHTTIQPPDVYRTLNKTQVVKTKHLLVKMEESVIDLTDDGEGLELKQEQVDVDKLAADEGLTLYRSEETVNETLDVQATAASLTPKRTPERNQVLELMPLLQTLLKSPCASESTRKDTVIVTPSLTGVERLVEDKLRDTAAPEETVDDIVNERIRQITQPVTSTASEKQTADVNEILREADIIQNTPNQSQVHLSPVVEVVRPPPPPYDAAFDVMKYHNEVAVTIAPFLNCISNMYYGDTELFSQEELRGTEEYRNFNVRNISLNMHWAILLHSEWPLVLNLKLVVDKIIQLMAEASNTNTHASLIMFYLHQLVKHIPSRIPQKPWIKLFHKTVEQHVMFLRKRKAVLTQEQRAKLTDQVNKYNVLIQNWRKLMIKKAVISMQAKATVNNSLEPLQLQQSANNQMNVDHAGQANAVNILKHMAENYNFNQNGHAHSNQTALTKDTSSQVRNVQFVNAINHMPTNMGVVQNQPRAQQNVTGVKQILLSQTVAAQTPTRNQPQQIVVNQQQNFVNQQGAVVNQAQKANTFQQLQMDHPQLFANMQNLMQQRNLQGQQPQPLPNNQSHQLLRTVLYPAAAFRRNSVEDPQVSKLRSVRKVPNQASRTPVVAKVRKIQPVPEQPRVLQQPPQQQPQNISYNQFGGVVYQVNNRQTAPQNTPAPHNTPAAQNTPAYMYTVHHMPNNTPLRNNAYTLSPNGSVRATQDLQRRSSTSNTPFTPRYHNTPTPPAKAKTPVYAPIYRPSTQFSFSDTETDSEDSRGAVSTSTGVDNFKIRLPLSVPRNGGIGERRMSMPLLNDDENAVTTTSECVRVKEELASIKLEKFADGSVIDLTWLEDIEIGNEIMTIKIEDDSDDESRDLVPSPADSGIASPIQHSHWPDHKPICQTQHRTS